MSSVGVRELRRNLSQYLDRVKDGESLDVTEHGRLPQRSASAGTADANLAEGRRDRT